MKIIFLIGLCLPLAVMAEEDIDYFNEAEHHNTPGYAAGYDKKAPSAVTETHSKKGWGQGVMEYFERLASSAPPQSSSTVTAPIATTTVVVPNPKTNTYLQSQLKTKGQEIAQVRQEILKTTDGQKLQELTGTLHRLEAEYRQLSEHLKQASPASISSTIDLSSSPAPVENSMTSQLQPIAIQASEEDVLKAQLATLEQQERELSIKVKSNPNANILSTLASQLERVQQNKSLVALSLQEVQRRNAQNSLGFAQALLPPVDTNPAMPVPALTPSLEQVLPPDLPTYPAGWGGFGVSNIPAQPTGKPMTAEEWKQAQTQAEATFQDKQAHTTYGAHSRPLWTPKDPLAQSQKSVPTRDPIDHRHLVEKIRKEKIFS